MSARCSLIFPSVLYRGIQVNVWELNYCVMCEPLRWAFLSIEFVERHIDDRPDVEIYGPLDILA